MLKVNVKTEREDVEALVLLVRGWTEVLGSKRAVLTIGYSIPVSNPKGLAAVAVAVCSDKDAAGRKAGREHVLERIEEAYKSTPGQDVPFKAASITVAAPHVSPFGGIQFPTFFYDHGGECDLCELTESDPDPCRANCTCRPTAVELNRLSTIEALNIGTPISAQVRALGFIPRVGTIHPDKSKRVVFESSPLVKGARERWVCVPDVVRHSVRFRPYMLGTMTGILPVYARQRLEKYAANMVQGAASHE